MPRRRMLDPDFWKDSKIKKLPPIERLLFLGLISNADDEGRIQADPALLRSMIFPYDDFTLDEIKSMLDHICSVNPNAVIYSNSSDQYLYFCKWNSYQKPSHPQPSRLPPPPKVIPSLEQNTDGTVPSPGQNTDGIIPSQVRLGQSSLGKVSIGKGKDSVVPADFTKYLDSEKDLTDRLTEGLKLCVGRPAFGMQVVKQLWEQAGLGKLEDMCFQLILEALEQRSPANTALCLAKAVKNLPGKRSPAKYLQTIFADHPDNSSKKEA